MSMTAIIVSLLFLATGLSAIRAPAVIYSAVIQNAQPGKIHCSITWSKPSDELLESKSFAVGEKQHYLVSEEKLNMGTWEARATIKKITCGDLSISAPFDKVISPAENWEFLVEKDKIISVGPSSS